ncbi:hypothetical protein [Entomospira culicis]|uniref:Uncharacterized protein n=1 Tax=Entomospira culicis TaxID=2719989 RepID=A0A968KW46_9SPIO|nr:hypothetical protein [Entomospira culicis]NIZ19634.1 hypothetical protein [Entomospira culicis]NIZ69848.1 hypothetical protein [Entomospira culicis]WDI36955.1 hypothetical protein PVA46_06440 [Entomospira culicis]WDI38584.1 hypothetical protein PVA47_06450 [Entomospira culicis]
MVKKVLKRSFWLLALVALVSCSPKTPTPDDDGKDNGGLDNGGNDNGGNDNGGNDNGGNDNGGDIVTIGQVEFNFDPKGDGFPGHAGYDYGTGYLVYTLVPVDRLDLYKSIYHEGAKFANTTELVKAAADSTSAETYIGRTSAHTTIALGSAVTLNIRMQATETSDGPSFIRSGAGTYAVARGSGLNPFTPASTNFSRWSKADADVKDAATLREGHAFYLGSDFYVMWGYASRHATDNSVIYSPLNSDHTVEQLDKFFRFSVVD